MDGTYIVYEWATSLLYMQVFLKAVIGMSYTGRQTRGSLSDLWTGAFRCHLAQVQVGLQLDTELLTRTGVVVWRRSASAKGDVCLQ